jgi:hypothetical protein
MSTITIESGGAGARESVTKDPADIIVLLWDWDTSNLGTAVQISDSSWAVAVVRPAGAAVPTLDHASLVGTRKAQIRVTGGVAGAKYTLTNRIVTNESPAQTKERSIYINVDNL